jgi:glycosyltransferase involved in cell wall biosynthesis
MNGPLRILIYDASPALGGALTSAALLAPWLAKRGYEVEVRAVAVAAAQHAGVALDPDAPPLPTDFDATHGRAYFHRETERAGVLVLKTRRPDLIIANNTPAANLAVHMAARAWDPAGPGLPVIQWVRGPLPDTSITRMLLLRAHTVLAPAPRVAADVLRLAPKAHVEIAPEAVIPIAAAPPESARQQWLWASSLAPWKGAPLLVEALKRARRALAPQRLPDVLGAYIPLGDETTPPATPPGLIDWQAMPDLAIERARSLVYIHTATSPEPFGRSVLEAMAAGLCPVVPDEGMPKDLVRNGVTGLVYKAREADDLAAALTTLARDPARARALGSAASDAARDYHPDQVWRVLKHLIPAAVASAHRRGQPSS